MKNTSYRTVLDIVDDESNISIEKGTLHYSNGILKMHTDNEIVAVSGGSEFKYISDLSDLPTAIDGIITLEANKTYYFTTTVDLLGGRLVCGQNTVILGSSSENSVLTSTGLDPLEYLIYSDYTLPIRHITIKDVTFGVGINISGAGVQPIALDWTGVNFSGCSFNLVCGNIGNFIFSKGAVLGGGKISFLGSVDTIGIDNSLFAGSGSAESLIELSASCVINRRFRIIYSSFVAFGSTTAIEVNTSATIANESYILDTINFSGGGTYLSGVTVIDNKTLFVNCKGIENTAQVSQYYMNGNATATTISAVSTPVKISGTTTSASVTQKFTNTDNKAEYIGSFTRFFKVTATLSATSGNNNQVGVYIAKNGTLIPESEVYGTTSGTGRAENIVVQTLVQLSTNDYIEIFVENATATNNVTVTDLNVIIQ